MIPVVRDEPYSFFPPQRTTLGYKVLRFFVPTILRRLYGVEQVEVRNMEGFRASVDAGHGVLLAPNHPRACDPFTVGMVSYLSRIPFHFMASWYLFRESRVKRFVVRNLGAFSIYRETNDRPAMNAAIDILSTARRPLVVFPEGTISRSNDRLMEMMDGVVFLARTAAKRRAKEGTGKVVIHPVATKYVFEGNLNNTLSPVLDEFETRFSWQPQRHLPLVDRVVKLLEAQVTLREMEYLGGVSDGNVYDRIRRLIEGMLCPLETEWLGRPASDQSVISRCKRLRTEILPELIGGNITEERRRHLWQHLTQIYYAQQISLYPENYLGDGRFPERLLETVEGFEEDLNDAMRKRTPWRAIVQIGDPIEVDPGRRPRNGDDPYYCQMVGQIRDMLRLLTTEVNAARGIVTDEADLGSEVSPLTTPQPEAVP